MSQTLVSWHTALTGCILSPCAVRGGVNNDIHLPHPEPCGVKRLSGGKTRRQRVAIHSLRRANWWLAVTDSLVFIDLCPVIWITIPDLLCRRRLVKVHFQSKSHICIKAYSGSPHEYLICNAAITHFTPAPCVLLLPCRLCVNACRRIAVQAGAAGMSHREGAHPEVSGAVSLSNRCPRLQGEQTR